ncbi:MAG: hypothetical protein ACLTZT_07290 [Butyricimonas faecalis]
MAEELGITVNTIRTQVSRDIKNYEIFSRE